MLLPFLVITERFSVGKKSQAREKTETTNWCWRDIIVRRCYHPTEVKWTPCATQCTATITTCQTKLASLKSRSCKSSPSRPLSLVSIHCDSSRNCLAKQWKEVEKEKLAATANQLTNLTYQFNCQEKVVNFECRPTEDLSNQPPAKLFLDLL